MRARRRRHSPTPRQHKVTAYFNDAEYADVLALAGSARMAVAAYVAEASLAPMARDAATPAVPAGVGELLVELMGVHRQLRGACTNLNQAVAKLNSLGEPVGELPAIAAYVRRVTTAVDELVARFAAGGGP
ncbi:hypothetical protein ACNTMW_31145 [Planosporangium sp. 12N6]|uniref:hypothetical protein n=1 Tax=Planosporangium spinosum TaxID=3402278 RepID=UPI003CF46E3B